MKTPFVLALATMLAFGCNPKDESKRSSTERPTPGIVGKWATVELMGSAQAADEDYWLFRADGTMVECNTVVGPKERKYELGDASLALMDLSGFATPVEIVSMQDGKMHVRFMGIDKKLEKLPPSDTRAFRCDKAKLR